MVGKDAGSVGSGTRRRTESSDSWYDGRRANDLPEEGDEFVSALEAREAAENGKTTPWRDASSDSWYEERRWSGRRDSLEPGEVDKPENLMGAGPGNEELDEDEDSPSEVAVGEADKEVGRL